ncbi:MAG: hypothetical protein F6K58_18260 [Symploca sp. SIO2E9]|nr:hypothetical protein [Symploca sp. SIO2E9]
MNQNFLRLQILRYNRTSYPLHKDAALSAVGFHLGLISQRTMGCHLSVIERQRVLSWLENFTIAAAEPTLAVNKLLCYLGWSIKLVGNYLFPLYRVYSLHELTDEQRLDLWLRLYQQVGERVIIEHHCSSWETIENAFKEDSPIDDDIVDENPF